MRAWEKQEKQARICSEQLCHGGSHVTPYTPIYARTLYLWLQAANIP